MCKCPWQQYVRRGCPHEYNDEKHARCFHLASRSCTHRDFNLHGDRGSATYGHGYRRISRASPSDWVPRCITGARVKFVSHTHCVPPPSPPQSPSPIMRTVSIPHARQACMPSMAVRKQSQGSRPPLLPCPTFIYVPMTLNSKYGCPDAVASCAKRG